MTVRLAFAVLVLTGCDSVFGLHERAAPDAPDRADASDAGPRVCEVGAPFVEMKEVSIAGAYSVEAARFNPTQSVAYLSLCEGAVTSCDMFFSAYTPMTGQLGTYLPVGVNGSSYDAYATVTPDSQVLVFGSVRSGGLRTFISIAEAGKFVTASELALISSVSFANEPYLSTDGQTLHLAGGKVDGTTRGDIYRARGGPPTFGGASDLVAGVNTSANEAAPVVSDDEREMFFASDRESTGVPVDMPLDIFVATRGATDRPYEMPVKVPLLSTTDGTDWPVWLSPDRCDLYYINKVSGLATLKVAHR